MNRTTTTLLLLCSALACAPAARAQSATTTFDVTLTIAGVCAIDTVAPTGVAFGTQPSTATNVDAAGQLNVNCTPGIGYTIALNAGQNDGGGGVASRAMAGDDDLVPYQLYQDAARSVVWGETVGADTLAGSGTGDVQEIPVYGRVPSANFQAGSYLDTITATITY